MDLCRQHFVPWWERQALITKTCASISVAAAVAAAFLASDASGDTHHQLRTSVALLEMANDTITAKVVHHGFRYFGNCPAMMTNQSFSTCSAGKTADKLCKKHVALRPASLHNASATNGSRQLRSHARATPHRGGSHHCTDRFDPWLLVKFETRHNTFERCAFQFGIQLYHPSATSTSYQAAVNLTLNYTVGTSISVWVSRDAERCIVGFDSPAPLYSNIKKLKAFRRWNADLSSKAGIVAAIAFVISLAFGRCGSTWELGQYYTRACGHCYTRVATDPAEADAQS